MSEFYRVGEWTRDGYIVLLPTEYSSFNTAIESARRWARLAQEPFFVTSHSEFGVDIQVNVLKTGQIEYRSMAVDTDLVILR